MSRRDYPIRTRAEQIVEARFGKPVDQVLRDLYERDGLSQADIASRLEVNRTTVVEWMKRHGIDAGYNRSAVA